MSKYGNRKTVRHGIVFDSAREASRYDELLLLERAGKIRHIEVHPSFPIEINKAVVRALPDSAGRQGRPIVYKADFTYWDNERGCERTEDVKGLDTPVSRLKRALVQHIYGVTVEIVK